MLMSWVPLLYNIRRKRADAKFAWVDSHRTEAFGNELWKRNINSVSTLNGNVSNGSHSGIIQLSSVRTRRLRGEVALRYSNSRFVFYSPCHLRWNDDLGTLQHLSWFNSRKCSKEVWRGQRVSIYLNLFDFDSAIRISHFESVSIKVELSGSREFRTKSLRIQQQVAKEIERTLQRD